MDKRGYKSVTLISFLIREGYDKDKLFNVKGGFFKVNFYLKKLKKEDL